MGKMIFLLFCLISFKTSGQTNNDLLLQKELEEIYEEDQTIRKQTMNGGLTDSLRNAMSFKDSINLIRVKKILDTKGWIGKNRIGDKASRALFLVIQHSDLKTQEYYLPMMREAVSNGYASASSLALLEDRIEISNGRKQIYGSQIKCDKQMNECSLLPLFDADNVDKRRAAVGLPPLAEYLKQWDIIWDIEEYKRAEKLNK